MGLLDFLFFNQPKRKQVSFDDKSKLNRQDIVDLVWNIQSLDSKQKETVREELLKELDDGGVTKYEFQEAVRKMSLNRRELGLSEIDIKNLRDIL